MKHLIQGDISVSQVPTGPLASHLAAFVTWATDHGYARYSRHRQVLLAAGFSRWLGQRGVTARRVSAKQVERYRRSRTRRVRRHSGDAAALTQFVRFLRDRGVVPAARIRTRRQTPVEQVVDMFSAYLRDARALAPRTIVSYVPFVRSFLGDRFGTGSVTLSCLVARDVVGFVQRHAPRLHVKRAKVLTTALRSFLRYGQSRGDIGPDLAGAVPAVAQWSMTAIPRAIAASEVQRLLTSIERRTAIGRRDYAIMLLLARLGLRAGEVAGLALEDLDWASGQVRVRGKGGHEAVLPLPADVGAIAAYLRHGRPPCHSRGVFVRAKAPMRAFLGAQAIGSIVRHRVTRAGITAPTTGAHQFRHALATQMLGQGASLSEIGEVLRHRSPQTTAIYTKVDVETLRALALPWPGGAR